MATITPLPTLTFTPTLTITPTPSPILIQIVNSDNPIDYVAIAGLVLAVLSLGWQIYNYFNDKLKVKIVAQLNMSVFGQTPDNRLVKLTKDKKIWSVTVSNVSRNPATMLHVMQVGADLKEGKKKGAILTYDYFGRIDSFTLAPGKSRVFTITYETIDPANVKTFFVQDQVGNFYRKKI